MVENSDLTLASKFAGLARNFIHVFQRRVFWWCYNQHVRDRISHHATVSLSRGKIQLILIKKHGTEKTSVKIMGQHQTPQKVSVQLWLPTDTTSSVLSLLRIRDYRAGFFRKFIVNSPVACVATWPDSISYASHAKMSVRPKHAIYLEVHFMHQAHHPEEDTSHLVARRRIATGRAAASFRNPSGSSKSWPFVPRNRCSASAHVKMVRSPSPTPPTSVTKLP